MEERIGACEWAVGLLPAPSNVPWGFQSRLREVPFRSGENGQSKWDAKFLSGVTGDKSNWVMTDLDQSLFRS